MKLGGATGPRALQGGRKSTRELPAFSTLWNWSGRGVNAVRRKRCVSFICLAATNVVEILVSVQRIRKGTMTEIAQEGPSRQGGRRGITVSIALML